MKLETVIAKLTSEGERRAVAQREAADAMCQIKRLAHTAHRAGAQKSAIARAAQISRVALDSILRE